MAAGDSKKVVLAALFANLGIAVIKAIAAVMTRSGAMLAETIHTTADAGNQALLLLGARRAKRPPDARHPFGYGSERYFWAFIVALVLFSLGALFSLYEGVHKLMHPTEIRNAEWAYVVLAIAIVLETISFVIARREVDKARGKRGFWQYFYSSKEPSLPLVFLEDLGALVGLFLALGGVSAADLLGWTLADGLATVSVGLLLGVIAIILFIRCHKLLIGEAATDEDDAAIRAAAERVDGVKEIVEVRTLQVGPAYLLVAMEVRMTGAAPTIREIEEAVRAAVPAAKYIAVEPV